MMFLDPCLFMPLSRSANIIFYFGSSAEILLQPVNLTVPSLTFVLSVSLPQNIMLHPVSPFPLCPVCLCHRTSRCILSHLFLCVQCLSATEHHAASCLTFSFVSSMSLPQNVTLHPVSLNFSSVSSVSLSRNIGCSLSCLFLCVQCVSAMEHRAASCESQHSLSHLFFCILPVFATDIVLHPVSLTFCSASSGSTLPLRYCALQNWILYTCRYCLFVCL